jgi:penicillin-binding protein 1A
MGYDTRQSLGDKETGARAALPIWMDFMKAVDVGKDDERFPGSEGSSRFAAERAKLSPVN